MEVSTPVINRKWLVRLPALTGAIFPIVGVVRGGGDDAAPTYSSTGQQIATYYHQHPVPSYLYNFELWAFLSIVVFTLVLYSRLRPAEPRHAMAAQVAVAACVISIAIKLGSFPAVYALYSSPVQLDPGVARPLFVMGEFAFTVSMLVESLSLGAVAISGLLFGGIPRWLAGSAGAVALLLAFGFTIGGTFNLGIFAFFLWLFVASATLTLRGPRAIADELPARTSSIPVPTA
jgi:hypothetical protein